MSLASRKDLVQCNENIKPLLPGSIRLFLNLVQHKHHFPRSPCASLLSSILSTIPHSIAS